METPAKKIIIAISVMLFACVFVLSCATTHEPAKISCPAAIEWQLTEQAEVTSFACEVGTFKKKTALIYTVSIKNTAKQAKRYRLNIFLLDQDKAAGHLIPRKGKPPVVKPGETVTVKVPFFNATTASKELLVVLKTIE
ncbi:MAG: hypothetical protein GWP07_07780 [Xanthomonadaceae bacterium]|nr:hypothetical protein [Xanthomonadaceae bacterium]